MRLKAASFCRGLDDSRRNDVPIWDDLAVSTIPKTTVLATPAPPCQLGLDLSNIGPYCFLWCTPVDMAHHKGWL
jgi:hypothetical protein